MNPIELVAVPDGTTPRIRLTTDSTMQKREATAMNANAINSWMADVAQELIQRMQYWASRLSGAALVSFSLLQVFKLAAGILK